MDNQVIYIVIAIVCVYGGIFVFTQLKKKKHKDFLLNTNFKAEFIFAEKYKNSYLNTHFPFVLKQMKGQEIDAINCANIDYSTKDIIKDGAKDTLKGIATLGTVKFITVPTTKYLILSGNGLHLLDTDAYGNISAHLVFDAFRLQNSSIVEIPSKAQKIYGEISKAYKISLATDTVPIELLTSSILFSISDAANFSVASNKFLQEVIIGNHFLEKLGQKFPNLKVPVPILS